MLGCCSPSKGCQQLMADTNSVTFWSEVAARYKDDGRVLFELYNEPHDVTWTSGRTAARPASGWEAVGMQQLYDAVRAAGAENLVIIGGLDWAFDLSGVADEPHRRIQHRLRDPPLRRAGSEPAALECGVGVPHHDRSGHRDGVRRSAAVPARPTTARSSSPTPTCTRRAGRPGPGSRADAPSPRSSTTGTERRRRWAWW